MNILAVDTAGKSAAVAILRDDTLLYETQCNNGMTHSETLLPMIDTALRACGLTMEDIDLLGVTSGPGSFTGLRIGLSVVKGLALPRQIPCAGVSTMAALAYGLASEGTVIGAQDARRGQVYWGAFGHPHPPDRGRRRPRNKFGKICTRLQKATVFCWRWRNFVLQ